ncbi:MAG: hypothetical protein ACR2RB_15365 [Gammaproteobacteria bacterium]
MHYWRPLLVSIGLLLLEPAFADVLKTPERGIVVVTNASTPTRGMSKTQVESRFGRPVNKRGPVGQPPISRWDYNGYSVFFEHHLVLHSVVRN